MTLEEIIAKIPIRSKEEMAERLRHRNEVYRTQSNEVRGTQYKNEKKYRENLRLEMIIAYGGHCIGCGEKDSIVLVLDHKNDDAQVDRLLNGHKGGYRLYAQLRRLGWPKEDHQLLCHNCNFRKEYYRRQGCPQRVLRRRKL